MTSANDPFELAGRLLAEKSHLTGPQARGTIRLALKDAGLDPRQVASYELAVVFTRLMPKRLEAQGLTADQAEQVCQVINAVLAANDAVAAPVAAATMFDRLDGARRSSS